MRFWKASSLTFQKVYAAKFSYWLCKATRQFLLELFKICTNPLREIGRVLQDCRRGKSAPSSGHIWTDLHKSLWDLTARPLLVCSKLRATSGFLEHVPKNARRDLLCQFPYTLYVQARIFGCTYKR